MKRFFIMFFQFIDTITSNTRNFIIEMSKCNCTPLVILYSIIFLIFLLIILLLVVLNILKRKKIESQLTETKTSLQKSLNFLRVVFDTIPDPIFCKNADGIYIDCNSEFEKSLGLKREEILNHTVYEVNQGEYGEVYHEADIQLMESKGKQIYESKTRYSDGKLHDILFRKATIVSENGEVDGLVGTMIDITDLKENENKINRLVEIMEAMLEINQSIIGIDNINNLFDLILEKALSIIDKAKYGSILILKEDKTLEIAAFKGYDPVKVKNFKIPLEHSFYWLKTNGNIGNTVIINDTYNLEGADIVNVVEEMKNWTIKSCISTPIIIDKKLYGMLNIDSNLTDSFIEEDAQIMQYMKSQIEIALSKHKLYEEIIYLSKYDKLTNLYNRSYFDEMFIKGFQDIINNNGEFNLVVFDLNNLKYVNDNYGHSAGDEYIKVFAKELTRISNFSDTLVRYGGDEFVGVFFNTDRQVLFNKFEGLLKYLKNNPINFDGQNVICSFSYGIANFPNDTNSYNQLLKIADERMYTYKKLEKY